MAIDDGMTVEITNLWKSYGQVQALRDCSLTVQPGELLALLGPSGCGKTTLLRTTAGFIQPDKGRVLLDGEDCTHKPVRERNLAFIMESWGLYPHLNVGSNIAYPLKLRGVLDPERTENVQAIASVLGIGDLLSRRATELSAGQKQRVAIARALVRTDARLLLADEALSNIDAQLRHQLRLQFKQLQKQKGLPCIFVTHSQDEALAIGDRVAVMHQGQILQVGTPHDLYHNPRSVFVAGFIGNPPMNFLPLTTDRDHFRFASWQVAMPRNPTPLIANEIIMGVRPESIALGAVEGSDVVGEVLMVENVEPEKLVHIKTGDSRLISRTANTTPLNPGEKVGLRFARDGIYFFDKRAGTRLDS